MVKRDISVWQSLLSDVFEHSINEDRYVAIGKVRDILFVVFTERKDTIRLISARRATASERRLYYDQNIHY